MVADIVSLRSNRIDRVEVDEEEVDCAVHHYSRRGHPNSSGRISVTRHGCGQMSGSREGPIVDSILSSVQRLRLAAGRTPYFKESQL